MLSNAYVRRLRVHSGRECSSLPILYMITTATNLVDTMRYLGDATSRNLGFSYNTEVPVSYGEETITESNLLELWRHHSNVIYLEQKTKHEESKVGADWEWYLIGRKRTLAMRVQAKRVQSNGVLKINHTVGRSGLQQYKLLIESAAEADMRPMYCISIVRSLNGNFGSDSRDLRRDACLLTRGNYL